MTYAGSNRQVAHEVGRYVRFRDQLREAYPELEDDDLVDTLEGLSDLHELIGAVVRSALDDQAMASGLKGRVGDMRSRLERLEARASKKRQLALEALTEAGLKKLVQPDFTISVRSGTPALMITAKEEVPDQYWVPQPAKLDRQRMIQALKSGEAVAGATMTNAMPALSVRTK